LALFGSLEGKRGDEFKKKMKEQVERIDYIEKGRLWEFNFLHNINSSSLGRTQKLYYRKVLQGLYDFFKFNLCNYNILKIKIY